jgi:hypothetical protein
MQVSSARTQVSGGMGASSASRLSRQSELERWSALEVVMVGRPSAEGMAALEAALEMYVMGKLLRQADNAGGGRVLDIQKA